MKYFKTPEFLFEVLGEKQSVLEVSCTVIFALLGSWIIYSVAGIELGSWQTVVAFILIVDVLAGCIANFSFGTNEFYSKRPKNRLIFIAIHIHILVIAWLLSEPMAAALIVWGFTIASAFLVNALKGKSIQGFIGANLMCYGILLLIYLSLPVWFLMVSIFFMIKVLFSFSVDHFDKQTKVASEI
ncbi:hypothetical protein ACMAZF_07515 [Psychrobium sp. nBUS_13]|uniref:hypothetical protein n=1 Tax=Psychrobium sp. nBUS_13 TaxID=3395319 RepID=UPI003EBE89F8